MATYGYKLPGECYVKQITCNQQGLLLKPKLLDPIGFTEKQFATLQLTDGYIITMEPMQANIVQSIAELQLRQDELNRDFESAILRLLNLLTPAQKCAKHKHRTETGKLLNSNGALRVLQTHQKRCIITNEQSY